jgi:hypothetical protein
MSCLNLGEHPVVTATEETEEKEKGREEKESRTYR